MIDKIHSLTDSKFLVDDRIKDLPLWSEPKTNELLLTICREKNIHSDVIAQLVLWIRINQHRTRRDGLNSEFDEIFENKKFWGGEYVD